MTLTPGTRLGVYEVTAQIGAGGMGDVYRARAPRLGRDVAVNVSAERFSERFGHEAQLIASLNHPNICSLFDVGLDFRIAALMPVDTPEDRAPRTT